MNYHELSTKRIDQMTLSEIRWITQYCFQLPRMDGNFGHLDNFTIRMASYNGNVSLVKQLLENETVDPSDYNNGAIRMASGQGHDGVVELLLADPRVDSTADNYRALCDAMISGEFKIVEMLFPQDKDFIQLNGLYKDTIFVKLVIDSYTYYCRFVCNTEVGCVHNNPNNPKYFECADDFSEWLEEEYVKWQYRIGGEKWAKAKNLLEK